MTKHQNSGYIRRYYIMVFQILFLKYLTSTFLMESLWWSYVCQGSIACLKARIASCKKVYERTLPRAIHVCTWDSSCRINDILSSQQQKPSLIWTLTGNEILSLGAN